MTTDSLSSSISLSLYLPFSHFVVQTELVGEVASVAANAAVVVAAVAGSGVVSAAVARPWGGGGGGRCRLGGCHPALEQCHREVAQEGDRLGGKWEQQQEVALRPTKSTGVIFLVDTRGEHDRCAAPRRFELSFPGSSERPSLDFIVKKIERDNARLLMAQRFIHPFHLFDQH